MIQASELRIGNWVTMGESKKHLHMDVRLFHAVIMGFETYDPEPIPLTTEILEKCGFIYGGTSSDMWCIKDSDDNWLEFEGIKDGVLEPYMYYTGANISEKAKPKYLHQLQNIYFALTGEELTVNL